MANQRTAEFLRRVPKGAPQRVAETISTAFAVVETCREKVAAVLADGRLSRQGRDEKISKLMAEGPNAHMAQLKAGIERDLAGIKSERERMRRRVTEANAFPKSRKAEVRQWLLRINAEQAQNDAKTGVFPLGRDFEVTALAQLVETTKDPLIIEAIATAPHYLSGLPPVHHETLIERVIEDQNHARLGILLIEEASFEEAAAAIKVAEADIVREIQPTMVPS